MVFGMALRFLGALQNVDVCVFRPIGVRLDRDPPQRRLCRNLRCRHRQAMRPSAFELASRERTIKEFDTTVNRCQMVVSRNSVGAGLG
jgi:hypothetical protein